MGEGDGAHVVVLLLGVLTAEIGATVHVADGEHKLGQDAELEQAVDPVATLVVVGHAEVLELAAQGEFLVDGPLGLTHVDVALDLATVTFHDGLVVVLAHIHEVELPGLAQLLVELEIDVLIEGIAAHAEEVGGVTIRAPGGTAHGIASGIGGGEVLRLGGIVEATDVAEIQLEMGGILLALLGLVPGEEAVGEAALEGPLAGDERRLVVLAILGGIGIEGCEGVGVLVGKGLHVVDVGSDAVGAALGTETHVLAALGAGLRADTFLAVGEGDGLDMATMVGVAVVERGVLTLPGIFGKGAEVALLDLGAGIEGIDEAGQVEAVVRAADEEVFLILVLAHPAAAERPVPGIVAQTLEVLGEVQFGIESVDPVVHLPVPVGALYAGYGLEIESLDSVDVDAGSHEGVVDAEGAFLIGAEDESAAELLVEGSDGHVGSLDLALDKEMGYAPALEAGFEALEGMVEVLQTESGIYLLALHHEVHVGIVEDGVLALLGANLLVTLGHKPVGLHGAVEGNLLVLLRRGLRCKKWETDDDQSPLS